MTDAEDTPAQPRRHVAATRADVEAIEAHLAARLEAAAAYFQPSPLVQMDAQVQALIATLVPEDPEDPVRIAFDYRAAARQIVILDQVEEMIEEAKRAQAGLVVAEAQIPEAPVTNGAVLLGPNGRPA